KKKKKKGNPMLQEFLNKVKNPVLKDKLEAIFTQIQQEFPSLTTEIKWNQPMFIMDGTFIIGFSAAKAHISIAPETVTMETFAKDIKEAGYEATSNLFKIREDQEVNWDLLRTIITFNMDEKKGYDKFWR
ncbi:iron chaperone, partial [Streptococcus suis]